MKTFNMMQTVEQAIQEFLNKDNDKNLIQAFIIDKGFEIDTTNISRSVSELTNSVDKVISSIVELKLSEQEKIAKAKELARKAKLETLASYKPKFTSSDHINLQTFELLTKSIEFDVNLDSVKQLFNVSDTSKLSHDKINTSGKNSYSFNWLKDNNTNNFYNDIVELCHVDPIQQNYTDNLRHDKKNLSYYADMLQFYKLFDEVYGIGSMQDTINQLEDDSLNDIEQLEQSIKTIESLKAEIARLKTPVKKVPAKKQAIKKVA